MAGTFKFELVTPERMLLSEDAAQVGRLLPHLEALRESGFEQVVEWTIEAVEARLTPKRRRR